MTATRRPQRPPFLLAALLCLGLSACNVPLVPPTNATPTPLPRLWRGPTRFGAQTHLHGLRVPYLRRLAAAGFDVARVSLVPWWAQSRHHGWMWTDYDLIYTWLLARHITPLLMLENPRSMEDVAPEAYVARQAAARYPRALVELGNEPDNAAQWPGFYPPHARQPLTPAAYWAIERQFARAWRAGNPRARISTGGTSGMDLDWQRQLIALIAKDGAFADGTISAIAVHPYDEPLPPRPKRGRDVVRDLARLKAIVPDGVEVWLTEYGLTDPTPADVQGWFETMSALGVPLFCWYEIQDDVLDGKVQPYGLVRVNGEPRAAYDAARSFLSARAERPPMLVHESLMPL